MCRYTVQAVSSCQLAWRMHKTQMSGFPSMSGTPCEIVYGMLVYRSSNGVVASDGSGTGAPCGARVISDCCARENQTHLMAVSRSDPDCFDQ